MQDVTIIRDVTDWVFDEAVFTEGCGEVGGIDPFDAVIAWGSWVREMTQMIDGFGAFSHYPCAGGLGDQPARDMNIYNVARSQWVKRMNQKAAEK